MSQRRFLFRMKARLGLLTLCWGPAIAFFLVVGTNCGKRGEERGYEISECAKCGQCRYIEWRGSKYRKTDITETDLSPWLRQYDPTLASCTHDWIRVCGWSSKSNISWDSFGTIEGRVLRQIKKLDSTLDHDAIRGMLDRYYAIYAVSDNAEKARQLEEFHQELTKLGTTRGGDTGDAPR